MIEMENGGFARVSNGNICHSDKFEISPLTFHGLQNFKTCYFLRYFTLNNTKYHTWNITVSTLEEWLIKAQMLYAQLTYFLYVSAIFKKAKTMQH